MTEDARPGSAGASKHKSKPKAKSAGKAKAKAGAKRSVGGGPARGRRGATKSGRTAEAQALIDAALASNWPDARVLVGPCLAAAPKDPEVFWAAAIVALHGDIDGARASAVIEKGLERVPGDMRLLTLLARARRQLGDRAGAIAAAEQAIAADTEGVEALALLAELAPDRAEALQDRMERLAVKDALSDGLRARLMTALGAMRHRRGAFDAAYKLFMAAKQIQNRPYPKELVETRLKVARLAFTEAHFARLAAESADRPDAKRMVFIVGLPRTGSTLVEQMLAAHSDVATAGETPAAEALLKEMIHPEAEARGETAEMRLLTAAAEDRARWAATYLDAAHARVSGGGERAVWIDKMPGNVQILGHIATVFPHARFVMTDREPRDVFVSCMRASFSRGQGFSAGIDRFAHYFLHQQAFAAHWRAVLGARMVDMRYETVVLDPEAAARRLVDHAGLDWEPACALPDGARGDVATASAMQVREKAHTRSIGQWRNYADQLSELTMILSMAEVHALERAS